MGKALAWSILALSLLPSLDLVSQSSGVPTLGLYHDDAIYFNAARSLASGGGFIIESLPWQPAQTKYPPLYPLYLSLAFHMAPNQPLDVALWLNWLWLPALVIGAYVLLSRCGLPSWVPVAIAATIAVHPAVMLGVSRLMSDLMYAALAVWTLVLASSALAGLAFLARTTGVTLMAALWLDALREKRWRQLASITLLSLVAVIGWSLWCRTHRHPGQTLAELYYSDYMAFQWQVIPLSPMPILRHLAEQLLFTLAASARSLLAVFGDGPFSIPASLIFLAVPIAGLVRLARREAVLRPYFLYAALLLPMLCFWYYRVDERALLSLLPLLLAGLAEGLLFMVVEIRKARSRGGLDRVLATIIGLALCAYPVFAARHLVTTIARDCYESLQVERRYNQPLQVSYAWIRQNIPPSATFLAINDPDFYLHTGHRAMRLPFVEDMYVQHPGLPFEVSPAAIEAMRHHHLDCVFLSVKHFARSKDAALNFAQQKSALRTLYQTQTEAVACLDPAAR